AASRERESWHGKRAEHIRISTQNLLRLPGDGCSVRERSPRRSLHHDDEIVLVLLRNETRRNVEIHVSGSRQANQKQNDDSVAINQDLLDHLAIAGRHSADRIVDAMSEAPIAARQQLDTRPVEEGILVFLSPQQ